MAAAPGATWQWQLDGEIDTSFDVDLYDIDLFDAPQPVINELHAEGRRVVCYFSAGTREEGREDTDEFAGDDYGNRLEDWPNERWLDVRSLNVRRSMEQRLDLAETRSCNAVEPDNVDGYQNDSGFPLTANDQLDYNRFLAGAAHARGLSIGLKNALELVPERSRPSTGRSTKSAWHMTNARRSRRSWPPARPSSTSSTSTTPAMARRCSPRSAATRGSPASRR